MLDLTKKAKEVASKESKDFHIEDDKKYVGYVSWRVGFMPMKNISSYDAAEPIFYMMQRSMPYAKFESFFVDVYNRRDKYHRPELDKLVEMCKSGQVDVVVIPSLQTLSSYKSDIIEFTRKLKNLPKPVYIYFLQEVLYSEEPSFELACDLITTMNHQQEKIKRKKRKMMSYIKECQSSKVVENREQ